MENRKTSSKKILIIVIIAALICAAGVFTAYQFGKKAVVSEAEQNAAGVTVDENAREWDKDLDALSGKETEGIKIPGYGELTVPAGDKNWNITLLNPKDNNCYFVYSITIDDSDEVLYESNYIEPGKAVTEFEVKKGLEAGEYKINLNIAAYSMDDEHTRLNGANVQADLHVVG